MNDSHVSPGDGWTPLPKATASQAREEDFRKEENIVKYQTDRTVFESGNEARGNPIIVDAFYYLAGALFICAPIAFFVMTSNLERDSSLLPHSIISAKIAIGGLLSTGAGFGLRCLWR